MFEFGMPDSHEGPVEEPSFIGRLFDYGLGVLIAGGIVAGVAVGAATVTPRPLMGAPRSHVIDQEQRLELIEAAAAELEQEAHADKQQ